MFQLDSQRGVMSLTLKDLCITSDEALSLDDLTTESVIAVVGGGYIAVEFSGIFNGLGANVHLFYRKPFPLRGSDSAFQVIEYTSACTGSTKNAVSEWQRI